MTQNANTDEDSLPREGGIIAFRAPLELVEAADIAAAAEGISRSDVARRALLRDLRTGEAR